MHTIRLIQTPVRFHPAMGGVENHVLYLARELMKLHAEVTVICADVPHSEEAMVDGISVRRLWSPFKVTNTDITPSLPWHLIKRDFDVIHTHMPTPWTCDWSILIAYIKRKKSILTIHNDMQKPGFLAKLLTDLYLNTLFRISLALVDRIIMVNPDWEDSFTYTRHLLKAHIHKISVIPNGVDTTLFYPHDTPKVRSLLFVSILDKYHTFKGFDVLLEAMPIILKTRPHVNVTVVGEGELRPVYEKRVADLGLQAHIDFVGYKSQEELPEYYSSSDVFVLPSTDTEGYGIVLLESMACGTPVVATDITGLNSEIRAHNLGRVVRAGDHQMLADSILTLLESKPKRSIMGRACRAYVVANYSWNVVARHVQDLYQSL